MQLLETITVEHQQEQKKLEFYHGDLAAIPAHLSVDVLVVSAYPNRYAPVSGTLVGALHHKGVNISALAAEKAVDLRSNFSCWLSKDIPSQPFRKVLCFEPLYKGNPAEVVGEIFQSLMPFVFSQPPITRLAMPIVGTGNQGFPVESMLEPLVTAAVHWLSLGLPVKTIRLVEYQREKAEAVLPLFQALKRKLEAPQTTATTHPYTYDLFLSYSRKNTEVIRNVEAMFKKLAPSMRIFLDTQDLDTGMAWQQELYQALDDCRMVMAFLSPTYIASKVCKEEFNIGLFRHRDATEAVLFPVFLFDTELPTYMKLIQFDDCREGNLQKLETICKKVCHLLGY